MLGTTAAQHPPGEVWVQPHLNAVWQRDRVRVIAPCLQEDPREPHECVHLKCIGPREPDCLLTHYLRRARRCVNIVLLAPRGGTSSLLDDLPTRRQPLIQLVAEAREEERPSAVLIEQCLTHGQCCIRRLRFWGLLVVKRRHVPLQRHWLARGQHGDAVADTRHATEKIRLDLCEVDSIRTDRLPQHRGLLRICLLQPLHRKVSHALLVRLSRCRVCSTRLPGVALAADQRPCTGAAFTLSK
mmetsp:Transcript_13052/g.33463  ORF Transcript_13052/g.33463 Transcript_13052/m.33463 type:complete len:242 (-) Transcript_13052:266-991(-)